MTIEEDTPALESRARRAAKRAGYVARKSRWRRDSIDNYGGFQIIDAHRNFVVAGTRYDLSAQDVIDLCTP
jgi:hypothetical protein